MKKNDQFLVPVRKLRWRCSASRYSINASDRTRRCTSPVGQSRALVALELGLGLWAEGYNLFVAGPTGSGRRSVVESLLADLPPSDRPLYDYAYVHNFERPEEPLLLTFPKGVGRRLQHEMDELVILLRDQCEQFLRDPEFSRERRQLYDKFAHQERRLRARVIREAAARGFRLGEADAGAFWFTSPMPLLQDRAVSMDELRRLADAEEISNRKLRKFERNAAELAELIARFHEEARELQKELFRRIRRLAAEKIQLIVLPQIEGVRGRFDQPGVSRFLDQLAADITESWTEFVLSIDSRLKDPHGNGEELDAEDDEGPTEPLDHHDYLIHLVLKHAKGDSVPIVHETHPTYVNLFGGIEAPRGEYDEESELRRIHGGSVLQADGGYLILDAGELMAEESAWPALKRTLLSGKLEIRGHDPRGAPSATLKPQPIPLRVKVILIGSFDLYQSLCEQDPDFTKVYKVLADFDDLMPRDRAGIRGFLQVVARIIHDQGLQVFTADAMAAMVECGARMAGHADRLTACFSEVSNLAHEADFWARKARRRQVERGHVERALSRMVERHGLMEEKQMELISDGFILMDLQGERIGQVNGLVIYTVGDHAFGLPCRITATAGPGEGPIHNIERMVELSGPSHDKGVLILGGFLRQRYATSRPLCLSASVCFEQSYSEVDGDSASLAEVVALISALAHIPVRQDLAMTGSINQQGEIQPVGEINEKIEGYYDICRHHGLTGTQGVIIPARNVPDLMLRADVVDAIGAGRFGVHACNDIDEVLKLMTGMLPGSRRNGSRYPVRSINRRVDDTLASFAEILRTQNNGHGHNGNGTTREC